MPSKWDIYSDQPHVIRDKSYKKEIAKEKRWDTLKMMATSAVVYPISLLSYFLIPSKKIAVDNSDFFGIGINLDKNPEETRQLIEDLGCHNILIRVPLHDIENLQAYIDFSEKFKDKNLLINILQDRRHVDDPELLKSSLNKIFSNFSHLTNRFQIGNAINRKKWAFFSTDEYLRFYKVAQDLKNQHYPNTVLVGSSVIDFEYYFTIRTLFNFYKVHFDQCSSLMYVDRRGAPENSQMGFNLQRKLYFLQTILRLSPKSDNEIVITETNWPITQTAPYAPTSEDDCVDLEDHANYLVRYYLLALATSVVKNVYWHQLIAPGYGLIDNRDGKLTQYPAYQAFKVMLAQLQNTNFINMSERSGLYRISFENKDKKIEVLWSLQETVVKANKGSIISRDGVAIDPQNGEVLVSGSPVYFILNKESH